MPMKKFFYKFVYDIKLECTQPFAFIFSTSNFLIIGFENTSNTLTSITVSGFAYCELS